MDFCEHIASTIFFIFISFLFDSQLKIMYMGFLVYFSLIMVSDKLSDQSSVAENFLLFWIVTFVTEEIRQV